MTTDHHLPDLGLVALLVAIVSIITLPMTGCGKEEPAVAAAAPAWFDELIDPSQYQAASDQELRPLYDRIRSDPHHVDILLSNVDRLDDTQVVFVAIHLPGLAKIQPHEGYLRVADRIDQRVPWASMYLIVLYEYYEPDLVWARLLKIVIDDSRLIGSRSTASTVLSRKMEDGISPVARPYLRLTLEQQASVAHDALTDIDLLGLAIASGTFSNSECRDWLSQIRQKYPELPEPLVESLTSIEASLTEDES